jgi:predicted DsbA family dithiol-disulfide isomerase
MESSTALRTLSIDIVSDVVCPWCYIGKRRLEAALAMFAARAPDIAPALRWHPFELNPDLPPEGIPRRRYIETKFGAGRSSAIHDGVRRAGEGAGLALDLDRIARQPNTRDAHRLIAWASAQSPAVADRLVEALFRAFFVEGRFIGDREVLAALAADAGLDAGEARAFLQSGAGRAEVAAAEDEARALGVNGVPFFIFDGRLAVSGAQAPDLLVQALAEAARAGEPAAS